MLGDLQHHSDRRDFITRDEVEVVLKAYFETQPTTFWRSGIQTLSERWQLVVEHGGGYC